MAARKVSPGDITDVEAENANAAPLLDHESRIRNLETTPNAPTLHAASGSQIGAAGASQVAKPGAQPSTQLAASVALTPVYSRGRLLVHHSSLPSGSVSRKIFAARSPVTSPVAATQKS